jgi:hypothetical protein
LIGYLIYKNTYVKNYFGDINVNIDMDNAHEWNTDKMLNESIDSPMERKADEQIKNKDIDELHSGVTALVDELSKRACKAESKLYAIEFIVDEAIKNGYSNGFIADDIRYELNKND